MVTALNSRPIIRAVVVGLDGDVLDLLDECDEFNVAGFLDASAKARDPRHPNLGTDASWARLLADDATLRVILAVDLPGGRARLAAHYDLDRLVTLLSLTSNISRTAEIGNGTIVQRGVAVGRNAIVGLSCKLNCDAQLHHDVKLGDFCTIAPGARLLGRVSIGRESYIGSGVIVLPRISIGTRCMIGAGAVVTRDVPDGVTAKGVPARW